MEMVRRTYRSFELDFRRHYQTTQKTNGFSYEQYEPAYQFGYDLAMDRRYRHRQWDQIEADTRLNWERHHGKTWDSFREVISHAWRAVRETLSDVENPDDPTFEALRQHYEEGYAERGYPAVPYETAYRYGYFLAADESHRDLDWPDIEAEVREGWSSKNEGDWETFNKAAQDGWKEVKRILHEDS